jgi:catechol 2,3-dioxygenase-like lactoylglutathione lyase family enzyme
LDHVNISVVDVDRTVALLRIAFPEFIVRGSGKGEYQGATTAWLHLGIDELYVSINTAGNILTQHRSYEMPETGINHVGFIDENVDDLQGKYEAAGFRCSPVDELPSRKRLDVDDADGIQWKFIQYMSDDFAVRNDYSI